jgi:hypothetical protein
MKNGRATLQTSPALAQGQRRPSHMSNGTLKLTASQLASVRGRPGDADYHGPNWAKIGAKQARYAKLETRIGQLMTERADMEDELADLIKEANAAIDEARKVVAGVGAPNALPADCSVCGANPRTHACDEEACEPTSP